MLMFCQRDVCEQSTDTLGQWRGLQPQTRWASGMVSSHRHVGPVAWSPATYTLGQWRGLQPQTLWASGVVSSHRHVGPVAWSPATDTLGQWRCLQPHTRWASGVVSSHRHFGPVASMVSSHRSRNPDMNISFQQLGVPSSAVPRTGGGGGVVRSIAGAHLPHKPNLPNFAHAQT